MKYFLMAAAVFAAVLPVRADFTSGLLARWTFNGNAGEKAALTDDVGGVTLQRGVAGKGTEFKLNADGSVTLGSGVYLFSDAVNSASEKFGSLSERGTIWCRIKFVDKPDVSPLFSFGLMNSVKPGDWPQLVLTDFYTPTGLGVRAKGPQKMEAGMGSGFLPVAKEGFSNVAIVFNGKTKKVFLFVDGKMVDRPSPMNKLDAFQSVMVGRLKAGAGQKMMIDELRIYKNALSAEWIDEIEPVEAK